jgi:hypothetical protein
LPYRLIFEVILSCLALVFALGFALFAATGSGSAELLDDGSIPSPLAAGYLLVVGYFLGTLVGTLSHETGHMVAAMAVSVPVRILSIGSGPVLFSGRIGETTLQLRWRFWAGGFNLLYPMLIVQRYRSALFILGGVAGNAVLMALLIVGSKSFEVSKGLEWVLTGAIVRQTVAIATNLFPRVLRDGVFQLDPGEAMEIAQWLKNNDGLQLMNALRRPADGPTQIGQAFATMLRVRYDRCEPPILGSQAAPRIWYQLSRKRWTDETERRSSDAAFMRELKRGNLTADEELLALDALATSAVLFDDPSLLVRVDEWTARALELAQGAETVRGTRGAALVQLGRYAEAKSFLEPLKFSEEASFDRILTHGYLARAECALGDAAAARHHASEARKIYDAGSHEAVIASFIERIEVEVAAARKASKPHALEQT